MGVKKMKAREFWIAGIYFCESREIKVYVLQVIRESIVWEYEYTRVWKWFRIRVYKDMKVVEMYSMQLVEKYSMQGYESSIQCN